MQPKSTRINDFKKVAELSKVDYVHLIVALQWHAKCYYFRDDPQISDGEYDELMNLLLEYEKLHPQNVSNDSPSKKVGGEIISDFQTVDHNPPMQSLDNAFTIEDVNSFHERILKSFTEKEILYHVEPKMDGIAIELEYIDSSFHKGSTRGDGKIGEDISHNVRTLKNVPLVLKRKIKGRLLVRGECVMHIKDFLDMNEALKESEQKLYANPRNLAAGSLRQKDSTLTAQRNLIFYPYSVISDDDTLVPATQSKIWNNFLPSLGFELSSFHQICNIESIGNYYDKMQNLRAELPYDIDGLVLKVDNMSLWKSIGFTTRFPKWAIALKFPSRSAITRLNDVALQVGRTGVITPVAHLTPVNIGGVMVKRASLHNFEEIHRLKLKKGHLVEVKRAGDVIPKISGVVKEEGVHKYSKIMEPKKCPSCAETLEKEDVYIRCINPQCPDKLLANIQYFASKDGIDIDGLGSEWLAKFFKLGLLRDIADIFSLEEQSEQLQSLEGLGEKSIDNILSSIASRKDIPLAIFLKSLGMHGIGARVGEILALNFKSLQALQRATIEELVVIHEIGEKLAQSLVSFFSDKKNISLLTKLQKNGVNVLDDEGLLHSEFENLTFVFTGTLEQFSRKDGEEIIKSRGGKASSSISKKTDYLIAGENSGRKYAKAKDLQVKILNEQEFIVFLKSYGIEIGK